ncbi:MAG: uroporphyrinogen-III C-methyltransferase [Gammaproteobacteria bacterium]|nr:uroporphyrinogen-III C-methyltransferase [Gammaproteobacteria bacterium]
MNSADAEVEEAEILEAEVVGNQQPPRTGKFTGLALVLSLAALLAAAGGALFTYQTRESMSADLAVLKIALEGARNETGELSQQLRTAHTSYQAQGQQLEEQKLVLTEQQKALAAHNQSLADREAKLEQERVRLEQAGREVREAIQSVHRRIGGDDSRWLAAEAVYLMQIANHRLQLEWDVQTAIKALETADERLREGADPRWIPIRELLASEIGSLKQVSPTDIEDLAVKLSGLAGAVKNLKLLGTDPVVSRPAVAAGADRTPDERTLQTLLNDVWEGFRSIMVIRHHGQPVSALLPPDQQLLVQQNLILQLEAARVSLLRGNQALFDSSLQSAVQFLNAYFDIDDAAGKSFLNEVGVIAGFKVRPQLPDISASLIALRKQLETAGVSR